MKPIRHSPAASVLFGTLLAFCFPALAAVAQTPATGSIQGRVLNASTGVYLDKARVRVAGTNLEALTDDFGEYLLRGVPAGRVTLNVLYTGETPQTATVKVPAGGVATMDVQLGGATTANGTLQLNPFVVESERYKNATELAINEERFSTNIKNVIAADAFGEIPSGNVGEFIKYLPGVELEYGGTYIAPTDAFGISVRGFGAADTAVYIDGVPVASASQASLTTQVGLDMLTINNASRVELVKVPTPDMPMNSVGGQINLISKSAFEYAKPSFTWRTYVTVNSEHPNPFQKIPGPKAAKVFAGQPGFELSYIRPVTKKFGLSLTASSYSQYSANRRLRPEWGTSNVKADLRPFGGASNTSLTNATGPASLANPFLTRISLTDAPRTSHTYSASLKGDWKPTPGLTLSGSYQFSTYKAADAARRLQFRARMPASWDATSTISLSYLSSSQSRNGKKFDPKSSLDMNIDSRDKEGFTHTGYVKAIYRRGPWDIFALASASTSRASFKDFDNGHFSTVDVSASGSVGEMRFENIADGVAHKVTVLDRSGSVFDWTKLSNWTVPTIQGRSGKAESLDDVFNYKVDVKRQLDFLPGETAKRLALKVGYLREETLKKKWGLGTGYTQTYTGPALTSGDYLDTTYIGRHPGFGFPAQEWISTYRLYDIYKAKPNDFTVTEANAVSNWFSYVGQNKRIKETRDAWYAMIEGAALPGNRLTFIAGLRNEETTRTGMGPRGDGKWNYLKNADGTLYRNVALVGGTGSVRIDQGTSPLFAQNSTGTALRADLKAKGIAYPAGVVAKNSLAGAMRQRHALESVHGESKGKPSYSINLAAKITDKIVAQLAYSRTFGRIPIEDSTRGLLSGNQNDFNVTEDDNPTAIPRGTISVANPNLLPEVADNWDFALKYYTSNGGKFEGSYYLKKIKNFSDTITTTSGTPEFNEILGSLGLDPAEYQDWLVKTSVNGVGAGKVYGYEFQVFQDLRALRLMGDWGRRVNVFATYSRSHRSEDNTTRISARPASSQLATAGIRLSTPRLSLDVRGTWSDLKFLRGVGNFKINGTSVQLGSYQPSNTRVDANLEWRFARRYAFYVSGKNIFQTGLRTDRMDLANIYPAYAQWDDLRDFGVEVTFGIKGSF